MSTQNLSEKPVLETRPRFYIKIQYFPNIFLAQQFNLPYFTLALVAQLKTGSRYIIIIVLTLFSNSSSSCFIRMSTIRDNYEKFGHFWSRTLFWVEQGLTGSYQRSLESKEGMKYYIRPYFYIRCYPILFIANKSSYRIRKVFPAF